MASSKQKAEAESVFKKLDKNNVGYLTRADLSVYADEGDQSSLDDIMEVLDPKKTGKISLAAFVTGFPSIMGGDDDDDDEPKDPKTVKPATPASPTSPVADSGKKNQPVRRSSLLDLTEKEDGPKPTSTSRQVRWKKILEWCKDSKHPGISQNELDHTIRFLARPFSDVESAQVLAMFKAQGFVTITPATLHRVVEETVKEEEPRMAQNTKNGEWNPDKFVGSFLVNLKKRISDPGAGLADSNDKDQIAALSEKVRDLERQNQQAKTRYDKLGHETSRLEQENADLRKQVQTSSGGATGLKSKMEEAESLAASYKERNSDLQTRNSKIEAELKDLKQEHSNNTALLQVERKIKKSTTAELKMLKEQVAGLQATHTAQNRLALKKKVGKMTAVMARRKFIRNLQSQNERIPVLEAENQQLRQKIIVLEDQAKEYLRLLDTYVEKQRGHAVDLPGPENIQHSGLFLQDEAELEELRKKLAEAEKENAALKKQLEDLLNKLEEERQAREEAERMVAQLKALLQEAEEKIKLLETENARLRAALAASEAEVADLKKKIAELEAEIARLKKELEDEIERRKALERLLADGAEADKRKIRELQEEIRRLMEELEAERRRRAELEAELERVKKALEEALRRIAELERELAERECEVVTIIEEKVHVEPEILAPEMTKAQPNSTLSSKIAALKLSAEKQAEITAYATCLNQTLRGDPDLGHLLPINVETPELLFKLADGLLVAKFINTAVPDTIDERALNVVRDGNPLSNEQSLQNLNLAISSAKSIGVAMHGDTSSLQMQLMDCTDPDQSIDFLYELIKTKYLTGADVRKRPELLDIAENPSTGLSSLKLKELEPKELLSLAPEKLLLRWLNWHRIAGATAQLDGGLLSAWGDDLKDSLTYTSILSRVTEKRAMGGQSVIDVPDHSRTDGKRAQFVLEKSEKLKIAHFHRPPHLSSGNERLNLLFSAVLLFHDTGLGTDDGLQGAGSKTVPKDRDAVLGQGMDSDSREERAFRMWVNSCGIPGVFLHNLFLDCRDGLAFLKVIDYVEPGTVDWKKVEMNPTNKFKCVANCNYGVHLCKGLPGMSIVGIAGDDIQTGNQTLILAIFWQLMRYHTIKQLAKMQQGKSGPMTEDAILGWVNQKMKGQVHEPNTQTEMKSVRDTRLSDSLFFLNLMWVIEPKIVDWKMVTKGETDIDKIRNAGYAISLARKLGAEIFLLPHDIVEVKPKMILLFVGSLMAKAV